MSLGACPSKRNIILTAKAMYPDASAKEIAKLVRDVTAGWSIDADLEQAQARPHSLVTELAFARATHDVIVMGEPRADYRIFVEAETDRPSTLVHFPKLTARERDSVRIVRKSAL